MTSHYRRLLGPAFDTMPASLRQFHDAETQWDGRATFKITRGKGWLWRLIGWMRRLPPAGEEVPVRLRVVAEGDGERWIRDFGKHRLESVQRAWKGLLVESMGGITLGFRLIVEGNSLRLQPARVWVLGLPWPRWLAPQGTAIEVGQEKGCAVLVRVELPLLGMLVQYEGVVTANEDVCDTATAHRPPPR